MVEKVYCRDEGENRQRHLELNPDHEEWGGREKEEKVGELREELQTKRPREEQGAKKVCRQNGWVV